MAERFRSIKGLIALAGLLLVATSCVDSERRGPGFAQEFEQEVFSAAGNLYAGAPVLVEECALLNGVEWRETLQAPDAEPFFDPAAGLDGRERFESIGTGIIIIAERQAEFRRQLDSGEVPADLPVEGAPTLSAAEARVLESGPVVTASGEFQGGCRQWAFEQIERSTAFIQAESYAAQYSDFVADSLENSPAAVALNEEWSLCMASQGFEDLAEPGDQFDRVDELAIELRAGLVDFDQALAFDVAIGTAGYDCNQEIEGKMTDLRDEIAQRFVELRGS